MNSILEINDLSELSAFRPLWRTLLRQTDRPSFAQSLEFLEAAWPHVSAQARLRVVLVSRDGETVGILPLASRSEYRRSRGLRCLSYPLEAFGPVFGPIGRRSTTAAIAGLRHIAASRRDWDVIELAARTTPDTQACVIERAAQTAGLPVRAIPFAQSALVELADSYDAYRQQRPEKYGKQLEHLKNAFGRMGRVEFRRFRPGGESRSDADPRWDLFNLCDEIARNGQPVPLHLPTRDVSDGVVPRILRNAHEIACRLGAVDLDCLFLNGTLTAFLYSFQERGRLQIVWSGCRQGVHPRGILTLLAAHLIRDSFARGDSCVDFGPNSLSIVGGAQTAVVTDSRLVHFSTRSLKAQLHKLHNGPHIQLL